MRDLLASLLGVPAAMFIAAGLGIVGVTIYSWIRPNRPSIRVAHLVFGTGLTGAGFLLMALDVAVLVR
jgi:hypothetical protein